MHRSSSSGNQADAQWKKNAKPDMLKVTGAFFEYANGPYNVPPIHKFSSGSRS